MEKFEIGEVAIVKNALNPKNNGIECTIIAGLEVRRTFNPETGEIFTALSYMTRAQDGRSWVAQPHQLRKKRLPTTDEAECRQAMLDCIERAKRGVKEPA